jgi:general secretion pathway protein I
VSGASARRGDGGPRLRRGDGGPRLRRGFTLLEVMVALAVLALAMTAVSDVVGGALQSHTRARQLEVATMLARARLAEAEAKFEEEGFRDFDQIEDGNFSDEGHPEVRWKVECLKPQVELGPDAVLKALTGIDGGVAGLLGLDGKTPGQGRSAGAAAGPISSLAGSPMAAVAVAMIQQQLTTLGEKLKAGVRELRLTVAWKDGRAEESFTVVTHLVVLRTGAQRRSGAAGLGGPQPGAPGLPNRPGLPGSPNTPPFKGTPPSTIRPWNSES